MRLLAVLMLVPLAALPAYGLLESTDGGILDVDLTTTPEQFKVGEAIKMNIDFINPATKQTQIHIDYFVTILDEDGNERFGPTNRIHTSEGKVSIPAQFDRAGEYEIRIDVDGILFNPIPKETASFTLAVGQEPSSPAAPPTGGNENGCLIATAAFGSEMAAEVQMLREIRDHSLLSTQSGTAFMAGFNQIYYSFSPTVADWERQNPAFREAVKIGITPLLASLSILNHLSMDSEEEVLGYGMGIIALNLGMYVGLPMIGILKMYQFRKNRSSSQDI